MKLCDFVSLWQVLFELESFFVEDTDTGISDYRVVEVAFIFINFFERFINTERRTVGSVRTHRFNHIRDPEKLREEWITATENLYAEYQLEDGILKCYDKRARMDKEKLILYPELIFRKYQGDELKEEDMLKIVMRCYYPEQFVKLIKSYGFHILDKWGGYTGEPYGEGPELVVKFRK